MSAGEWANLQYALLDVFGPVIHWWIVLLEALGVFIAVMVVWLALLRWLNRVEVPMAADTPAMTRLREWLRLD